MVRFVTAAADVKTLALLEGACEAQFKTLAATTMSAAGEILGNGIKSSYQVNGKPPDAQVQAHSSPVAIYSNLHDRDCSYSFKTCQKLFACHTHLHANAISPAVCERGLLRPRPALTLLLLRGASHEAWLRRVILSAAVLRGHCYRYMAETAAEAAQGCSFWGCSSYAGCDVGL